VTGGTAGGQGPSGPAGLSALFEAAAAGLGPAEREVIELRLRQGFADGEVAAVLGVSRGQASRLVTQARTQLEANLGALLAGRAASGENGELGALLAAGAAESFRRAPGAPADLRLRTMALAAGSAPGAAAHRATVLAQAGAFRRQGFPRPAGTGRAGARRATARTAGRRLSCQGRAAIAAVVALGVSAAAAALGGGSAPVPAATRARPPSAVARPRPPGPGWPGAGLRAAGLRAVDLRAVDLRAADLPVDAGPTGPPRTPEAGLPDVLRLGARPERPVNS
jgi:predicted DNA-binding protein (UPF0251 family)